MATRRLELVAGLRVLDLTPAAETLADYILQQDFFQPGAGGQGEEASSERAAAQDSTVTCAGSGAKVLR